MKSTEHFPFRRSVLAAAVLSQLTITPQVFAQEEPSNTSEFETIEITATRRSGTVQDAPINITALSADVMEEQNIGELADIARWVPGLTITDQGGREGSPIIVRGLNTNSSGPSSDGGTVATYLGEIPLYIDMRLLDVERVEVLIGPQGTLYGAGTLGGAIRYIPKKADLHYTSGEIHGDVFTLSESDSLGGEGGFVFNLPVIEDTLGWRTSVNYYNNPGFIDYNYVVKEPGVSLPDPDWIDPSAISDNLRRAEDANGEKTLTARTALRWVPQEGLDVTLNYMYQNQEVEGRSISQYGALADSNPLSDVMGQYESAYRYEEPLERTDELLSLEVTADLEFAELVSATGKSSYDMEGQRDQTDLLIRLAYSYEEFPAFSSFTRELTEEDIFTQELRLVSKGDSALSWIVGGFYNKIESWGDSSEFTPGFDDYALDVWGVGGNPRPDDLEYYSVDETTTKESAIFGELSYQLAEEWSVTFGLRRYDYSISSRSAVDLPLYYTVFDGRASDSLELEFLELEADDSGTLFKFNTSYDFSDDVLGYVTISEGFRIGGTNGVAACDDDVDDSFQSVCALPHEVAYQPDTTTNYEVGFKTGWMNNKLYLNGAVFFTDWEDAQISGATYFGQQPILMNAGTAESKGFELSSRAMISDHFTAYATYSYTAAKLTSDAVGLFIPFEDGDVSQEVEDYYSGLSGDRLPGSPEHQVSFGLKYTQEVFDHHVLEVNYGLTAQSDLISKVGLRANGETIPGYSLSNLSAKLIGEDWTVTLYVDNLFDKYAYTSARRDFGDIGQATYSDFNANRPDILRNYGHYITMPRKVGVKFSYSFGE